MNLSEPVQSRAAVGTKSTVTDTHVQSKLLWWLREFSFTHEKCMLKFLLGRGRGSVSVSQLLSPSALSPVSTKFKHSFMQFCILFRHQPASIIQGGRRRRCLFNQFWEDFKSPSRSAVSGFRWLCSYAMMQMYLSKELGRVVYKHQALEEAQLRWLFLSNTIHAREHDYHLFIQYYTLQLCIINVV